MGGGSHRPSFWNPRQGPQPTPSLHFARGGPSHLSRIRNNPVGDASQCGSRYRLGSGQPAGLEQEGNASIAWTRTEEGSRQSAACSLWKGGASKIWDIGPESGRLSRGFLPLHEKSQFPERNGIGWMDSLPETFQNDRPDSLSADGARLKDSSLRLRVEPGRAILWALIGNYGNVPTDLNPPTGLVINGVEIPFPASSYQNIATHFERADDATLALRGGGDAIFDTYVLPRYSQLITEIETANGELEIQCQEGKTCPIVAIGWMRGGSAETAQREILSLHSRRRAAFTHQWATLESKRFVKPQLEVSMQESERGFVPRSGSRNSGYSKHSSNPRECTPVMNGLRISVSPGSRAILRMGIFP